MKQAIDESDRRKKNRLAAGSHQPAARSPPEPSRPSPRARPDNRQPAPQHAHTATRETREGTEERPERRNRRPPARTGRTEQARQRASRTPATATAADRTRPRKRPTTRRTPDQRRATAAETPHAATSTAPGTHNGHTSKTGHDAPPKKTPTHAHAPHARQRRQGQARPEPKKSKGAHEKYNAVIFGAAFSRSLRAAPKKTHRKVFRVAFIEGALFAPADPCFSSRPRVVAAFFSGVFARLADRALSARAFQRAFQRGVQALTYQTCGGGNVPAGECGEYRLFPAARKAASRSSGGQEARQEKQDV